MGEKRPLKLLQLIETRWNSEFLMVERIVKLKISLSSLMEDESLKFQQKLTESDWCLLENIIIILQPFYEATECMSGSKYPTLSMTIPVLLFIRDALENFEEKSKDDLPLIIRSYIISLKNLRNRFDLIQKSELYIKAMVLDPRFRRLLLNDSETETIIEAISSEIFKHNNVNKNNNSESLTGKLETFTSKKAISGKTLKYLFFYIDAVTNPQKPKSL